MGRWVTLSSEGSLVIGQPVFGWQAGGIDELHVPGWVLTKAKVNSEIRQSFPWGKSVWGGRQGSKQMRRPAQRTMGEDKEPERGEEWRLVATPLCPTAARGAVVSGKRGISSQVVAKHGQRLGAESFWGIRETVKDWRRGQRSLSGI